jgi:hypothetical protein
MGCRRLKLLGFPENLDMKAARLSALGTVAFTYRRYPWYSFLLKAELTPGP